jgi:hypothetical protein
MPHRSIIIPLEAFDPDAVVLPAAIAVEHQRHQTDAKCTVNVIPRINGAMIPGARSREPTAAQQIPAIATIPTMQAIENRMIQCDLRSSVRMLIVPAPWLECENPGCPS